MKQIIYTAIFISILINSIVFISCSEDPTTSTTTPPPPQYGGIPTIRLRTGANYKYTNDSLINTQGNITTQRTRTGTSDVIQPMITVSDSLCFPIISISTDTANNLTSQDTAYILYDSTRGLLYQYGISQLINPSQQPKWDLIADFSIPRNTTWQIGTINYSLVIPNIGTINFTGPLNGRVTDSTVVQTTSGTPVTYPAFKTEISTNISGLSFFGTITATVILDYYIGYNHPTAQSAPGILRIRLNPFSFNLNSIPILYMHGYDRILQTYIAP